MSSNNQSLVPASSAGITQREGFGTQEIARGAETSSQAVAAQAQAMVQAKYVMALQRPRDMDNVRVALLKECRRPGFAEAARYSKPVGGQKITGLSIRFAETALRLCGNVWVTQMVTFDDAEKRIKRISATDLETNTSYDHDVSVEKTVERRFLKDGQVPLRSRQNSQGQTTYLVQATDDEMLNKENALVSKALRNIALKLIPGDILAECEDLIVATLNNRAAVDPDLEKKRLADAFAGLGITPSMLKEYLGHDFATVVPAELVDLRAVFASVKDGEATWQTTMEGRAAERAAEKGAQSVVAGEQAGEQAAAAGGSKASQIAAKVQARRAASQASIGDGPREPGSDG